MTMVSIGTTLSGKDISVDANAWKEIDILEHFAIFSDHDVFDALLAIEYLLVVERRRRNDLTWEEALDSAVDKLSKLLGRKEFLMIKAELGITSAFDARDYGKARLHWNFQADLR